MYDLAIGEGKAAAYIIALITVSLGGGIGWWLRKLISPLHAPVNAIELGRQWAGWIVFAACVSLLSRFFGKLDFMSFFSWLVGGGIWSIVAFVVGWGYGRLFRFKPASHIDKVGTSTENQSSDANQPKTISTASLDHISSEEDERIYRKVGEEISTGNTDLALWTRLYAECDGDENKTKARYIQNRVKQIITGARVEVGVTDNDFYRSPSVAEESNTDKNAIKDRDDVPPKQTEKGNGLRNLALIGLLVVLIFGIYRYKEEHSVEANAPLYKVGDTWQIQRHCNKNLRDIFGLEGEKNAADECDHPVQFRIEAIGSDASTPIQMSVLFASGRSRTQEGWAELWFNEGDLKATENSYRIRFPLSPGKSWQVDSTSKSWAQSRMSQKRTYSVGQWEVITVQAGEFRVLPIIEKIENFGVGEHLMSVGLNQLWYSPKVGISVKTVINDRLAYELKSTGR